MKASNYIPEHYCNRQKNRLISTNAKKALQYCRTFVGLTNDAFFPACGKCCLLQRITTRWVIDVAGLFIDRFFLSSQDMAPTLPMFVPCIYTGVRDICCHALVCEGVRSTPPPPPPFHLKSESLRTLR